MSEKTYYDYEYPTGKILLAESEGYLVRLCFEESYKAEVVRGYERRETALIKKAASQLREYFEGKRREFDLPLRFEGTEFQKKVWAALLTIPYGETRSYGEIAAQVGNPKGPRAVGMANNRNPIAIICPCHRVIGADGRLVGFGGGLPAKEYMLRLEGGRQIAAPTG